MAFWIEVDWARAAEDREVQVGEAQDSGEYLCVRKLAVTSLRYFQGKFLTGAHGEPGIMGSPSHVRTNVGRDLCLRATGGSGTSTPGKECPHHYLSLDSITLTPSVSIGFKSDPFPIIIHA